MRLTITTSPACVQVLTPRFSRFRPCYIEATPLTTVPGSISDPGTSFSKLTRDPLQIRGKIRSIRAVTVVFR